MQSAVLNWGPLQVKPTPVGAVRKFFDAPTATLENFEGHATTLNPAETPHAPHRHPDEELIILREGTLDVYINGEPQCATAGAVIFFASDDLHGVKNVGDTPATYYVFRFLTAPATRRA